MVHRKGEKRVLTVMKGKKIKQQASEDEKRFQLAINKESLSLLKEHLRVRFY